MARAVVARVFVAICLLTAGCSSRPSTEATWDFSDSQQSSIADDDFTDLPKTYYDSTVTIIMDADFAVTLSAEQVNPIVTDPASNIETLRAVRFAEFDLSTDEVIEIVSTWAEAAGFTYELEPINEFFDGSPDTDRRALLVASTNNTGLVTMGDIAGGVAQQTGPDDVDRRYEAYITIIDRRAFDERWMLEFSFWWPDNEPGS